MPFRLLLVTGILLSASSAAAQSRMERVRTNDNRARAGVSMSGTLAVRLEARLAEWHPQGEEAPGAVIPVFAEIGRQAYSIAAVKSSSLATRIHVG